MGDALVCHRQRPGQRTAAEHAVDLGRVDRRGGDGVDPGLAQRAVVAPRRVAAGRAPLSAQRDLDAQPVGWLLPDRADRVEPAHLRPVARPGRSGRCCRTGAQWGAAVARHLVASGDPFRRITLQASRRTGVPAAGLVRPRASFREPSAAAAADGDDDRRSIQHTRRLGASR
ncbi:Uncharacterised protein [Mycobacterium tuberculosis]|nr:Uncharacterised protein [Mycobacterium tuberculosis]